MLRFIGKAALFAAWVILAAWALLPVALVLYMP